MKMQHHEKRFLDDLSREFETDLPMEDKEMLVRIWRRHGGNPKAFVVAKKPEDVYKDKNLCSTALIYVQGGKFHKANSCINVDRNKPFAVIAPTKCETEKGVPVKSVYIF